jgi:uncharacterized RDD family membrane protein YckC
MARTETGSPAYAPVWKRAVTVIVDGLIVGVISGALTVGVLGERGAAVVASPLLGLLIFLGYYIGLETASDGQTLGNSCWASAR